LGADLGRNPVVGGLFDEDPAGVRIKHRFLDGAKRSPEGEDWRERRSESIAAFADASFSFAGSAGAFGGDKSQEGHEIFGMLETTEGPNFGDGDHGGDEFESFEGHHCIDEGFALPVL